MTNYFKDECKKATYKNRLGKVELEDKTITNSDDLVSIEFNDSCVSNGEIIGNTNAKTVKLNTLNTDELVDKEIHAHVGVKYSGKNLFDKDNANTIICGITNNVIQSSIYNRVLYISCRSSTTYTIQKRNDGDVNRFRAGSCVVIPANDVSLPNAIESDNSTSITITTGVNDTYLAVMYYRTAETILTEQQLLDSIQIEEGSSATSYEPYSGGNGAEYLDMGKYTITDENIDKTAKNGEYNGIDSKKLDETYTCNIDTFPCTVSDFYKDVCNQLELTPKTLNFLNSDFEVEGNPFTNNESYRIVLQNIGQIACSFLDIDWTNKTADLVWFDNDVSETFTKADYSTLEKNQVYGPINSLSIGESAVEGENVVIEQSGKEISAFELYGNTKQTTYTGKNLYNPNYRNSGGAIYVHAGSIEQVNDTFEMTATGTDLYVWEVATSNNTPHGNSCGELYDFTYDAYTLSISNSEFKKNYITYWDENKKSIGFKAFTSNVFTFYKNAYSNAKYFSIRFGNGSAISGTTYKTTIQLEQGTTATSYEPYVGGTASPNPDYPQEIDTVTGRLEVGIEGKNLVKDYTTSPILTQYQNVCWAKADLKPDTTYTISFNGTEGNRIYLNEVLFDQVTFVVDSGRTVVTSKTKSSISTSNRGQYNSNNGWIIFKNFTGGVSSANVFNELQIEESSVATEYTLYQNQSYEINLGKNLFDKDNANIVENAYVNTAVTSISQSGSGVKGIYIPIIGGNTYTISKQTGNVLRCATTKEKPAIGVSISDVKENNGGTKLTITTSPTAKYLFVNYIMNTEYSNEQKILSELQIEQVSIATDYSPYKTPIELCKIGDYQDYIRKSTGKNLFNYANWYNNRSGIITNKGNISIESDKIVFTNPTGTDQVVSGTWHMSSTPNEKQIEAVKTYGVKIEPSTMYVISYYASNYNQCLAFYYDKDYKYISLTEPSTQQGGNRTIRFTTPSNARYVCFRFDNEAYNKSDATTTTNVISNIQLEKSDTATSYEPYGKVWYKYKTIGKTILDENVAGYRNTTDTSNLYRFYIKIDNLKGASSADDNAMIFADKLKSNTRNQNYYNNQGIATISGLAILYINDCSTMTFDQFKNWLASNNILIYYVLETPTYEKITDDELINQLDAIEDAKLFDGKNYITLNSNIDTTAKLNIDYLQDSQTYTGSSFEVDNTIYDYNELTIQDNYFMYTEALRWKAIEKIWNRIKGFTYIDYKLISYTGKPYLRRGNKISIQDSDGNYFDTYILNHTFTYDGTFKSEISAEALKNTQTALKNSKLSSYFRKVERSVDKVNGRIDDIIEEVDGEVEHKLSEVTQTIDGIEQRVSKTETSVTTLDGKITTTNGNVSALDTKVNGVVTSTNTQISTINQTVSGIDTRVSSNTSKITTLTNAQTGLEEKQEELEEDYTALKQTVDSINLEVNDSGGVNLLKNSVMYVVDDSGNPINWTVSGSGTIGISSSATSLTAGAISGNVFTLSNKTVKQTVSVKMDDDSIADEDKIHYSFSTMITKNITGTCYVKLYNNFETHTISIPTDTECYYDTYTIEGLLPKDNYYIVEFYSDSNANATFTDNILAVGSHAIPWVQSAGEVNNTQVNVSTEGIKVKSSVYDGDYTVMSPIEFSGYSKVSGSLEKVFSLNKDTTEVKKLSAEQQINMPPLKIVAITTGSKIGWAFVKGDE